MKFSQEYSSVVPSIVSDMMMKRNMEQYSDCVVPELQGASLKEIAIAKARIAHEEIKRSVNKGEGKGVESNGMDEKKKN